MRKAPQLIVLFLLLFFISKAQKNYPALLDRYLQAQVKVNGFSGAVLVAQKGKVIYKKPFGLANREWNVPNTIQTKFRIASITKQFTAAGILQLVEAGKLNLNDKLNKFFPDFPKADSVTIHMLLNHTSGIKSYTNLPNFFSTIAYLPYSKDSVVGLFKNEPYEFSPGTKWHYNNSGYFLLGYIIEKVTGQSYGNYILENLIKKAGLTNTSLDRLDSIMVNRAMGYTKTPSGWSNAQYQSMEFPYSAGAMISTVEDMHQWNKALFGGKIISSAMLTKMITPYLHHYGYGLFIDSFEKRKHIGHPGIIPGFSGYSDYYPAEDVYIVVLSNNSTYAPYIAIALSATLFDIDIVVPPYKHQEVKIDSKQLDKYFGKYKVVSGFSDPVFHSTNTNLIELVIKEGKLFRRVEGTPDIELKPESNHKFFYADGSDRQFNFILDEKNVVIKTQFIYVGVAMDLKKID